MTEEEEIAQVNRYLEMPETLSEASYKLNLACRELKKSMAKEFPFLQLAKIINKIFGIKNK